MKALLLVVLLFPTTLFAQSGAEAFLNGMTSSYNSTMQMLTGNPYVVQQRRERALEEMRIKRNREEIDRETQAATKFCPPPQCYLSGNQVYCQPVFCY